MKAKPMLKLLAISSLLLTSFTILPAGELSPPGAPAPSMKRLDQIDPSTCIESLPFTITSPGRYTLCGDLTGVPGQPGIIVLASDVTIDGDGFVLQGVPGSADGIFVEGDRSNVQISRVIVRGWDAHGVHAPGSSVTCSSVVSSDNAGSGFVLNLAELEDCAGNDNGGDGADINAFKEFKGHVTLLKRSSFSGNSGAGLRCVAGSALDCDDVRCDSNGAEGMSIVGGTGHVTVLKACASSGNGGTGLFVVGTERLVCEDSSWRDNDSDDDGVGDGVHIVGKTGHVTLLKRCDSSGNGGTGLRVSSADLVSCEDSTFLSNGEDGMRGNGTHFPTVIITKRCDFTGNVGSGLHLSDTSGDCDDSRFVDNGENGITATVSVADASPVQYNPREIGLRRCDVSSNAGHGLHASTLADDTSLRVVLSLSSLSGNGLDGCRVDCPNSSVSSTLDFQECFLSRNGGSGLHVTPGPDEDCDGILERCVANSNGVHGFHVDASSSSRLTGWNLKENKGSFNQEDGFRYGGGGGAGKVSMQDFHFTSNGGHGVHIITGGSDGGDGLPPSSLDVFTHNGRLLDNTGDGLHMAQGSGGGAGKVNVQDLSCSRNGGSGAFVAVPATIEDSNFQDNSGSGLHAKHTKTGHVTLLKRVASTGNGERGILADCDDTDPSSIDLSIIEAVCSNNGGNGVEVDGGTTAEYVSLNFEEIKVTYNEQKGVRVSGGSSSAPCDVILSACDSSNNGGDGFDVVGSTGGGGLLGGPFSVTGSGGSASGNGGAGINIGSITGGGGAGKASFKEFTISKNSGSGFLLFCPTTLEECDSSNNQLHGFDIQGKKEFKGHVTLLKRCAATGNEQNGLHVETTEAETRMDLQLMDVVCSNNGQNGVSVSPTDPDFAIIALLWALSANGNGENGVLVNPLATPGGLQLTLRDSSVSSNTQTGLFASGDSLKSCTVASTEACNNGNGGMIMVAESLHVESSLVSGNTGSGLTLSSSQGGVVRDNTCSSNTDRGITINTSHVEYSTNRCVSNGGGGIDVAGGFGNVLHSNFASGNALYGIQLQSSENRLFENSNGLQVNPLFSPNPGVFNDTAPLQPAAVGGTPNIGL